MAKRQGIEAQLGVETTLVTLVNDLVDSNDTELGVRIPNEEIDKQFDPITSNNSNLGQPIKLAVKKEPEKIERQFFTEVKEDLARKKEVLSSAENEQPKKELVNNIHLGEISTSVLELIKYPAVVRAYFYALELSVCYRLNKNDTLNSALSILRDAIFAAQYDKPLPKGAFISSSRALPAGTAYALQNSISVTEGVIDATIQAYECED